MRVVTREIQVDDYRRERWTYPTSAIHLWRLIITTDLEAPWLRTTQVAIRSVATDVYTESSFPLEGYMSTHRDHGSPSILARTLCLMNLYEHLPDRQHRGLMAEVARKCLYGPSPRQQIPRLADLSPDICQIQNVNNMLCVVVQEMWHRGRV